MKALVYHGIGEKHWEEKPDPTLQQPTDAIVVLPTPRFVEPTCIFSKAMCRLSRPVAHSDMKALESWKRLGRRLPTFVWATACSSRVSLPVGGVPPARSSSTRTVATADGFWGTS